MSHFPARINEPKGLLTLSGVDWSIGAVLPRPGLRALQEALRVRPEDEVATMAAAQLEHPDEFARVGAILPLVPRAPLLQRLRERLADYPRGGRSTAVLIERAVEVGTVGATGIPMLRGLYEESGGPGRLLAWLALLAAMAESAGTGQAPPPELDAVIETRPPSGGRLDARDMEGFVAPALARIAAVLPLRRAEAAALRCLDPAQPHPTSALRLLPFALTSTVLTRAGQMLGQIAPPLRGDDPHLAAMMTDLGEEWVLVLTEVLRAAGHSAAPLLTVLRQSLSGVRTAALTLALQAADGREPSLAERIQALSDGLALPTLSVYLLENTEEPAGRALSRAGGAAFGVSKARWPRDGDEPMVHLLTLDLDELPELRARRPALAGARAIAIFVPDRDHLTEEVAVLELHDGDLCAGLGRTRVPRDEDGQA